MKLCISMLVLAVAVGSLCIWDKINTEKVFSTMQIKSEYICEYLTSNEITDEILQNEIINLNNYWTKKMDTLSISISRKDMQPISDYLQYLCSSIVNESQEEAVTYSKLLNYNIIGLKETLGINFVNLL